MNPFEILIKLDSIGFHTMRILISILWQSTILFSATGIIIYFFRNKSSYIRKYLWITAILLMPVLPMFTYFSSIIIVPKAEINVLPSYSAPYEPYIKTNNFYVTENINSANNTFPFQSETINPTKSKITFSVLKYPWAIAFIVYLFFASLFLSFVLAGKYQIKRWAEEGKVITERKVIEIFQKVHKHFSISKGFVIVEHPEIPTPFTAFTFHPIIFLPSGFTENLTNDELTAVAAHELAHVKRNDSLIFGLISFIRALNSVPTLKLTIFVTYCK